MPKPGESIMSLSIRRCRADSLSGQINGGAENALSYSAQMASKYCQASAAVPTRTETSLCMIRR